MLHARSRPPIGPCRHRPYSSGSSRRHAGSSRRIRSAQASIADSESFPTPRAESPHLGPAYHRIVRDTCAAETIGTIRNRGETMVASQPSSRSGSSKILASVFRKTQNKAGTERPKARI